MGRDRKITCNSATDFTRFCEYCIISLKSNAKALKDTSCFPLLKDLSRIPFPPRNFLLDSILFAIIDNRERHYSR